jgi:hypothetical protein
MTHMAAGFQRPVTSVLQPDTALPATNRG